MSRLIMVSKSQWIPAIRREHALAVEALRRGVAVTFVEAPDDIRSMRAAGAGAWLRGLAPGVVRQRSEAPTVFSRSTLVPGHRHPLAATADNALLRRQLRRQLRRPPLPDSTTAIVVNLPWQWPATAGLPARRVFDAADNWDALLEGRRPHVRAMYRRIADEADGIVVANPSLQELFPGRSTSLVANGTPADLVVDAVRPRPADHRMVYAGTLSHRFDVDLVAAVLRLLPAWRLDVYGECRYPGHRGEPAPQFVELLRQFPQRLRWHGVIARNAIGQAIDAADVAVVPHRMEHTRGQSSMKLADYAARGRPIVSTPWESIPEPEDPPGTWIAADAEAFAAAVESAYASDGSADAAAAWARERTWASRWPSWSAAVLGTAALTRAAR